MSQLPLPELLALALPLVASDLVDHPCRGQSPEDILFMRLRAHGVTDEACASRAAREAQPLTLPARLQHLCDELFEFRRGLPTIRQDLVSERVMRVIDLDALVCLHPKLRLPATDPFDWPAVHAPDTQVIEAVLGDGTVDTHVHLGGALSPLFYWLPFVGGELSLSALRALPTATRRHAPWQTWVNRVSEALVLRMALLAALWHTTGISHRLSGLLPPPDPTPYFHKPCASNPVAGPRPWRIILNAAAQLVRGQTAGREASLNLPTSEYRGCVLEIGESVRFERESNPDARPMQATPHLDPIRDALNTGGGPRGDRRHYAAGERLLCYHLGQRLHLARRGHPLDSTIDKVAFAYLRTRNAFYELLLHGRGADGLLRFLETFRRRRVRAPRSRRGRQSSRRQQRRSNGGGHAGGRPPGSKPPARRRFKRDLLRLERTRMAAALDAQLTQPFGQEHRHGAAAPRRAVELRVSPPVGPLALPVYRAWLSGFHDHLTSLEDPGSRGLNRPKEHAAEASHLPPHQIALVLHFIKQGEGSRSSSLLQREVDSVSAILQDYPFLRRFIVGIDAAGLERSTPPRHYAAAFHQLSCLQQTQRPRPGYDPIKLGVTYHVGEDCWDLMTGLRHIDEVRLLHLGGQPGRLGHALALGQQPEAFYQRRRFEVSPPLGTHLLDAVWALHRLEGINASAHQHVHAHLRKMLWALNDGNQQEVDQRIRACWHAMGLSNLPTPLQTDAELLAALCGSTEVNKACRVDPSPWWLEATKLLQSHLRTELAIQGVTQEANPTSNMLVGGFGGYGGLPYGDSIEAGMMLSINTDDPGIFMTHLPNEYMRLYQALKSGGLRPSDMTSPPPRSHREIVAWLRNRAQDAWDSTFIGAQVPFGAEAKGLLAPAALDHNLIYDPA